MVPEERMPPHRGLERAFRRRWDSEACILGAPSRSGLVERGRALVEFLATRPETPLADLAFSLGEELEAGEPRLAIVAASTEELKRKLEFALERLADPHCLRIKDRSGIYFFAEPLGRTGSTAFMFPGEGSQYPTMLADLCLNFPEVRQCFDLADRAFASHPRGYVPSQLLYPPPGRGDGDDDPRLWQMDGAVEAVFTASLALRRLLEALEVRPQAVVGHSTGEYAALMASGSVPVADDSQLIALMRGLNDLYELLSGASAMPEAALTAVGAARREDVLEALDDAGGGLYLAMDNCPHQLVLCGGDACMAAAEERLRLRGAICERLRFRRPYHTPLFDLICEPLERFFAELPVRAPEVAIYSCATAAPMPPDVDGIRELAVRQWALPVRFRETVEAMHGAGIRIFVEVGPRGNLTSFVDDTLRAKPHAAIAMDVRGRSGTLQLNHLVAQLAAHGVPLRVARLFQGRGCSRVTWQSTATEIASRPTVVFSLRSSLPALHLPDHLRPVAGVAARPGAGAASPQAPLPSPPGTSGPVAGQTAPAGRSSLMLEYLRTTERLVESQRRVMAAFLGGGDPSAAGAAAAAPGARLAAAADSEASLRAGTAACGAELPLIGAVVSEEPGRSLVTRCLVSLASHPYLRDHALGSRVSEDDPELSALPLMMLTMAMELMAQAAARLRPGSVVVGMRDVAAHRWIALARERQLLQISAVAPAGSGPAEVRVELREVPSGDGAPADDGQAAPLLLEATVLLAEVFPQAPSPAPLELERRRPSRWAPEDLYSKVMFHGPRLRGVASVDSWAEDGAEMTLRALPADGFFPQADGWRFMTDPVLLDAAGQVVGFWTAEHLPAGFVVFPFRVRELQIFGPAAPAGEALACRARIALAGDSYIRSDFEVLRADGRLHLKVRGWEDKRIPIADEFFRFRFSPRDVVLSRRRPAAVDNGGGAACRLEFADRLMETEGRIWREGLAHLVLSRDERAAWSRLDGNQDRRTAWLLERAAAKDAVRMAIADRCGRRLCPADIEIVEVRPGLLRGDGSWAAAVGGALLVETSLVNGAALATVSPRNPETSDVIGYSTTKGETR